MKISFNDMLYAFSYALDCVEHDLVGVTTFHSKRISYLSIQMGRNLNLNGEELLDLAACAALHDNALTEYIKDEYGRNQQAEDEIGELALGKHCLFGEKNVKNLPFCGSVKGAILYHHECADGSGPFGKKAREVPLYARIIHLCDQVDAMFDLSDMDEAKYEKIVNYLKKEEDKKFDHECVTAFLSAVSYEKFSQMENDRIEEALYKELPMTERDYAPEDLIHFSTLYANIVDYKSEFTGNHSLGIAKKCFIMAKYYGYDEEKQAKLYFAGAVHDIGKLVVARDILEKPDKLTKVEYEHIKNHAYYTYLILRKIKGLEEITNWASFHHEKLNGKGYPFGKTGDELGKEERLIACLDIYQALTEKRPYKEGMSHEEVMQIMNKMVEKNELDGDILKDIDTVFSNEKNILFS
ncbi:MAG: HD-GYP domain-containing protein [Velocimicrobium sp.]